MTRANTEARIIADVQIDGRTTIATARGLTPEEWALIGVRPLRYEFTEGLVGYGIARCRPEDHYDEGIGVYLAVTRAGRNLLEQIEQRALAAVQTQQQFEVIEAAEDAADAINELLDIIQRLASKAGVDGGFEAAPR